MDKQRLFIAATLPPRVKAALANAQARLRRSGAPVRWVMPELMHLTLQFLGELDATYLPGIEGALRQACANHPAQRLCLTTAGAFPNVRRPSVVWAGIGGDTAALVQLVASIRQALAQIGIVGDNHPFRPHLTLGRTRRDAALAAIEQLGDTIRALPQLPPAEWLSKQVVLFRSELGRNGPVYTELAACHLQSAE